MQTFTMTFRLRIPLKHAELIRLRARYYVKPGLLVDIPEEGGGVVDTQCYSVISNRRRSPLIRALTRYRVGNLKQRHLYQPYLAYLSAITSYLTVSLDRIVPAVRYSGSRRGPCGLAFGVLSTPQTIFHIPSPRPCRSQRMRRATAPQVGGTPLPCVCVVGSAPATKKMARRIAGRDGGPLTTLPVGADAV
jgi:hypothetical protein